ncbi:MAG: rhomboid family intramembrane serine protease [Planctomycetota bacterium]
MNDPAHSWNGFKDRVWLLAFCVLVLWGVEAVDAWIYDGRLDRYGIHPETGHWSGILFAPFLHADFGHLAANTIPFLVLGSFVILRKISDFVLASISATLIGGLGVWATADPTTADGRLNVHLGASSVVFGYLGFLLVRALFERSLASLVFALAAFFLYGGLVMGVLDKTPGVSMEGHLFGLVGGGIAGWLRASEYRLDNTPPTAPE